ncbi:HAD-IA family hydrolase [Chitinolyticbacter meiyuanensis]|uniref:HAD-IA family hydrolase n=1 Tax=Chitinolyticbacter meiyuanensis TaxID=682798 RepID=UPI0011E5DAE6|nr:HAD-IA family hydrolase [Chitinolyticbacter meiyuanensis]
MPPLSLLVFDWDGTLMDSTGTIAYAIQRAFDDVGLPVPSERDARFVIGYGLKEAMAYLAPGADEASITRIVDAYRVHYLAQDQALVLFDGVRDYLPQLRDAGYTLAVATGKSRVGLDRALASTGLGGEFLVTRTADEAFSKPHPAMLEYIVDFAAADAAATLMIGDTTHDLQMAINAGTHSAAMSYGAHPLDDLLPLSPLAHFDHFGLLARWLLEARA